mmetsp:Transcript_22207/g.69512  ORF Transcript_22207/g.69512 Transcript_22207/m.69512 type:complete len:92 (+) Transcript_22207:483-758(+)
MHQSCYTRNNRRRRLGVDDSIGSHGVCITPVSCLDSRSKLSELRDGNNFTWVLFMGIFSMSLNLTVQNVPTLTTVDRGRRRILIRATSMFS